MDSCHQCSFVYEHLPVHEIPSTIQSLAQQIGEEICRPDASRAIRARPSPEVWSALEYASHVRDVLLVQRERALVALVEDNPSFARMYRDERVSLAGYERDQPDEVADQLAMAAVLAGRVFEGLSQAQLARRCVYNYPSTTERNVAWLGRHTVHEASHHLMDMRTVLARVQA